MGYKQDGCILNVRFYTDDSVIGSWLTGDLVDRAFLTPLADAGVLENCRYISLDLKLAQPIGALASIRLIVPIRDNALALNNRAIAEGFEMVTYHRGQGVVWQVHPS